MFLQVLLLILSVLAVAIFFFLRHYGVFMKLLFKKEKMGPLFIAYDTMVGPYKNVGPLIQAVFKDTMALKGYVENKKTHGCGGVYWDNPSVVGEAKCRSSVGIVIDMSAGEDEQTIEAIKELCENSRYKWVEIPRLLYVKVGFPIRKIMGLSYMIGAMRCWSGMNKWTKKRKIDEEKIGKCGGLEVTWEENGGAVTNYCMMPLEKDDVWEEMLKDFD